MKSLTKILLVIVVIVIAAAGFGFYQYYKKPADVRKLKPDYELTAVALLEEFNKNDSAANSKYLNKIISVKGSVTEVKLETSTKQATVILNTGDPMAAVTCSFYEDEIGAVKELKTGSEVVIKGMYTGKLMDVVLNKCSIQK